MALLKSLGARVHLFVRPEKREEFVRLFREVLECTVIERDFGMEYPVVFVPFEDGSAFSVEFSGRAPDAEPAAPSDEHAFRGAWIEFRTSDLTATEQKLSAAGVRAFRHPGSIHNYYIAPGGQVFRVLDVGYKGP